MNIVLTGPMGSGKTAIGKMVSEELRMSFIDIDAEIVKITGQSIEEIFTAHGEDHFRDNEESIVKKASDNVNCIIATGGGSVIRPVNMRRLRKNGIIINLRANLETLLERTGKDNKRPLLKDSQSPKDSLSQILKDRADLYNNADYFIDTDNLDILEIAETVIQTTHLPHVRICASIGGDDPLGDVKQAPILGAAMIELRFDLMDTPDVKKLVESSGLPIIATDRKGIKNLKLAIDAGCDFIDIDIESPNRNEIIQLAKSNHCKVIVSHHDFDKTPEILKFDFPECNIIKLATQINSGKDYENLSNFLIENDFKKKIVVGMGRLATHARVLFPLRGSYLTYAFLNESTAPGQLSVDEMVQIYRRMGLR